MRSERILLLALAAALGLGCALILLPFLTAMVWAAILVYCLWPIYLRCLRWLRPSLAALLVTLVIATLVLIPVVHVGMVAAKEARQSEHWVYQAINEGLPPAPASLAKIPIAGPILTEFWNSSAQDLGGNFDFLQPALHAAEHTVLQLAFSLTHRLVGIVVALFIAYFFFLSGAEIVGRIRLLLVRIMNENRVEHLLELVANTVRGVVVGILGTAAMQGIFYAIGFEVAGAPQALLLATVAGLMSIVPAGAIVIYVPLCLFMLAEGHALAGILLAIYCFVVVGGADSIVRPWLIARGASLPYVVTLIGVIGGAVAFGPLGIFLGPVFLALGLAVAEEFAGVPRGEWRRP